MLFNTYNNTIGTFDILLGLTYVKQNANVISIHCWYQLIIILTKGKHKMRFESLRYDT